MRWSWISVTKTRPVVMKYRITNSNFKEQYIFEYCAVKFPRNLKVSKWQLSKLFRWQRSVLKQPEKFFSHAIICFYDTYSIRHLVVWWVKMSKSLAVKDCPEAQRCCRIRVWRPDTSGISVQSGTCLVCHE